MRISGRLALEGSTAVLSAAERAPAVGYHGVDILVRMLSAHGFVADVDTSIPTGAQVRLRLPGLGAAHAHVVSSEGGELRARFANPIGMGRLSRVPGVRRILGEARFAA